ncbi:MAG: hypothetical protein R3F29_10210 [Planctomycetota bacterium]
MSGSVERRTIAFGLPDLAEQLEAFVARWPAARADVDAHAFAVDEARLALPLAAPRPLQGEWPMDYVERLPGPVELQVVLLLRAGAMAFGCWRGAELLQHKAVRRYVVRGSGRAQATHLKTHGKSRYGSRLRLQNWKRLLGETNERLADCFALHGVPDRLFFGVPVRVLSELFAAEPPPPFARDAALLQRLPLHVHRPDHEELLRVRAATLRGVVELPA